MANNKNMDPPPPYTATDFHGINAPTARPPGPPPPGFVIPPGAPPPTQTGKIIIVKDTQSHYFVHKIWKFSNF